MKICHVLPSFARGGGERLVIELANREAAAGHEVTLVVGYRIPAERSHGGLSEAVRLRYVGDEEGLTGIARYRPLPGWIWRERDWLCSHDVLHCHLTYGAVFASLFQALGLLRSRRKPAVIETYHAVGMPIPRIHRWFHARMAARRDALSFMVEEPWWSRFLDRHPKVIGTVIPVGITAPDRGRMSPEDRAAYRSSLGIPHSSLVVGTIGRLMRERQSHRYIPIFARIAEKLGPDVHFYMGGDGPEQDRVQAAILEQGLEGRVHLAGLVRQLEPAFAITDLYITSNVGGVCGVAGMQAVAAGLPVIALQLLEEQPDPSGDWIWSSTKEEVVARRAVELLGDPAQLRALADRQGRYLAEHHSAEAMMRAYERLYRQAIDARQGR